MRGTCPHCGHDVFYVAADVGPNDSSGATYGVNEFITKHTREKVIVAFWQCPNCLLLTVMSDILVENEQPKTRLVWPFAANRALPPEVPSHTKKDYVEAAEVLTISETASAALSRRCLQTVLKEAGGAKKKDLSDQIEEVIPLLPTTLGESVDHIRVIGNFASHPIKSQASGQIMDVESGEAEWNLDVLDMLFDFYYVLPAKAKEKREAVNRKLKEAGKPPMK